MVDLLHEVNLTEKEYDQLAQLIYQKTGINLGDQKRELIKARLMKRLRALGLKSFHQYFEYVVNEKKGIELVEMIDAISTNVTSFFREKQHFDFLTSVALPDLLNRKKRGRDRRLRAWCSACSTGEEPYTIMLTLLSALGSLDGWDFKLLATDISTKVLNIAQNGVYNLPRVQGIPALMLEKYFDQHSEGKEKYYAIKPEVKQQIVFRRLNLMMESFPFQGKFDFIFCRNVMIYFDRPTQHALVERMCRYLHDDGYLFIGHSESLAGFNRVNLKTLAPATFQKIG